MVESDVESGAGGGAGSGRRRRVRRDASQWRALIEQQRVSGQSVKAFCGEHDLGEASFYAWRRHLRRQAAPAGGAASQASESPPSTDAKASTSSSVDDMPARSGPRDSREAHGSSADDGHAESNAAGFVRLDPQTDASNEAIEVHFACGTTLRCASSHLPELVRLLQHEASGHKEGGESC